MTDPILITPPPALPRQVYCGVAWPLKGSPAYYCVLGEEHVNREKSFEIPLVPLAIMAEGEAKSLQSLFDELVKLPKLHCKVVFAALEPKFKAYIKEFMRFRAKKGLPLSIKQTRSSSFESSILKIKEAVSTKRLKFESDSIIRKQLTMFSRDDLGSEVEFYAVRALAMVIEGFREPGRPDDSKDHTLKEWF